tara:strand:- start:3281 stop:3919 length:639 start_codon:yes stop_codon:yes gene_type:complete
MPTHKLGEAAYGIDDAEFEYVPDAVTCSDAEYAELEAVLLRNPKKHVTVFGKTHHPKTGNRYKRPRHEATYNKDYTYSGVTLKAETVSNTLVDKAMAHANAGREDHERFKWCMVNLYTNGEDNVGMHRDNERDVKGNEVRTYSFGADRHFVIRERVAGKRKRDTPKPMRAVFCLAHSSCGVMRGPAAQVKWEHGLPKMKRVTRSRISITPRM